MSCYVFQQVRARADVQTFEKSRDRGRVVMHSHQRAIWLACEPLTDRGGAWHVEYRIEVVRWWDPLSKRRGDQLVEELVGWLLEEWVKWRIEII